MTKNDRFTIGWISPLPLEHEAAGLNAFYLGGRIGKHEVVIRVQRRTVLEGAAILAEKMRSGFPNIKSFLLVGIAGGVPRYGLAGAVSEIVLGDVVLFVHFGNVASSNQLQISATERNRIQKEHDSACFEMEAADVLLEYPCVVVRGICDYADSHKNKAWQNYAAGTAAASVHSNVPRTTLNHCALRQRLREDKA
ncbi:purine and uridine phosphorylase [Lindgomyces ingoldianus]|uniref:Purine and uridine phosphorylase n=1 Tax=Lindgomyces ingoldianus TaxID=673940 RepID=A0ACB6QI04_9PLEO|nr:purine and uridine phosphorylase [Lindgomyces ingoldianus]KAF2466515.1 purine and uridine phosphorylase [Lindgomyces ingoldianus]